MDRSKSKMHRWQKYFRYFVSAFMYIYYAKEYINEKLHIREVASVTALAVKCIRFSYVYRYQVMHKLDQFIVNSKQNAW